MTGFDPERRAHRVAPFGAALALAGGCAGGWLGLGLVAVGFALLLLACASRTDGLLILGPFVRVELTRAARTKRPWLWRAVYAAAAGAILVGNVYAAVPDAFGWDPPVIPLRRLAAVNQAVTTWFAVVLFGYVSLLTVQLMSPIVAEEREAKRLDLLLTTDLRAREILLGKVAGRLPQVLDPVLASLPVLAVTPMLGGTSPRIVLGLAAATLATVAGLTGLSVFYSVFAANGRKAADRVGFLVVAYLVSSGVLLAFRPAPRVWNFPASVGVPTPVVLGDVILNGVNAGNPFTSLVYALEASSRPGVSFEDLFVTAVGRYSVFQAGVLALFGLTAAARLRRAIPWAAAPVPVVEATPERKAKPSVKAAAASARPPVGDLPVYWWERFGVLNRDQLRVTNSLTAKRLAVVWAAAVVLLLWVWLLNAVWPWGRGHAAAIAGQFLKVGLWLMTLPILLGPAMRAARSVARDRAADTLDALRLTSLTGRDVLVQKWAAAALSEWPLYKVTIAVTAAGAATLFVHPLALVGLAVLLPVYAAAGAAFGLLCSVLAKTPGRATFGLVLGGGASVYVLAVSMFLLGSFGAAGAVGGGTVPFVATGVVVWSDESTHGPVLRTISLWAGVVSSPVLYGCVGLLAWWWAVARFRREWTPAPESSKGP